MRSDKDAIRILHDLLQNRDRWYLDVNCADISEICDIGEKAKENADAALSDLSINALYARYRTWIKSEPMIGDNENYFDAFLSQTAWDLGLRSLRGDERRIFEEGINLTIHFL